MAAAGKRPLLSLGEEDEGAAAAEEPAGGPTSSGRGDGEGGEGAGGHRERHYRGQRIETPSHPGGVSERARETAAERDRRLRDRGREGVYASTSGERDRRDDRGGGGGGWEDRYGGSRERYADGRGGREGDRGGGGDRR